MKEEIQDRRNYRNNKYFRIQFNLSKISKHLEDAYEFEANMKVW